ncbi:MAG: threonine--tRNA ligase, partial [Acidobacteria bacterium]|nr:threonine--tRNA ligase [Acidobacteriota bacterium]
MTHVTVTLPDGSRREVDAGATVAAVAAGISPRLASAALAAVVDGRLVDLSHRIEQDGEVRIVTADSPESLDLVRHSTAH